MHPGDPFRQPSPNPRSPESLIFIERQSLERFLEAKLPPGIESSPTVQGAARVSTGNTSLQSSAASVAGLRPLRRPGRRKGQGSFDKEDEPLLAEMNRLIADGRSRGKDLSPHAVAKEVADKATGASFESKTTRLARKYRQRYS